MGCDRTLGERGACRGGLTSNAHTHAAVPRYRSLSRRQPLSQPLLLKRYFMPTQRPLPYTRPLFPQSILRHHVKSMTMSDRPPGPRRESAGDLAVRSSRSPGPLPAAPASSRGRCRPRLPPPCHTIPQHQHAPGARQKGRHGTARYGTVRHGTARYGTVRHGTARANEHGAARANEQKRGTGPSEKSIRKK